ncbi:MAG: iron-containing alcohol dehydrogenase [Clostridiales bacterium]
MVNLFFQFSNIPKIMFGFGMLQNIVDIDLLKKSSNILLISGESIKKTKPFLKCIYKIKSMNLSIVEKIVFGEPSPGIIDNIVSSVISRDIDLVIAIGGGSVLDAGKAVSAMLPLKESVLNYLEGVGNKDHSGVKIPFIAVPTTSGTGSETTKNAVLSNIGSDGFKKSLRHENFIPNIAIIDPELMISCPRNVTVYSGLDALSQLIEGYLSPKNSPLTDCMALDGIRFFSESFIYVCTNKSKNLEFRSKMAYAAFLSGVVLANAGLGVIHGFASPIGGFFPINHGIVCGRLLPEVIKMNVDTLKSNGSKESLFYLKKYAKVANILTNKDGRNEIESCNNLVNTLYRWIKLFEVPDFKDFGVKNSDFERIINNTSMKNNPVKLSEDQLITILRNSMG